MRSVAPPNDTRHMKLFFFASRLIIIADKSGRAFSIHSSIKSYNKTTVLLVTCLSSFAPMYVHFIPYKDRYLMDSLTTQDNSDSLLYLLFSPITTRLLLRLTYAP